MSKATDRMEIADGVLRCLGAFEAYKQFRKHIYEDIARGLSAPPKVVCSPGSESDKRDREVMRFLNRELKRAPFGSPPFGDELPLMDYYVALPLVYLVADSPQVRSDSRLRVPRELREAGEKLWEARITFVNRLATVLELALVNHFYDMTGRHYWVHVLPEGSSRDDSGLELHLKREAPSLVASDRGSAYRMGRGSVNAGVQWVRVKLNAPPRRLPLSITTHAVERLRERVPVAENQRSLLHYWVWHSAQTRPAVRGPRGNWMIEVCLDTEKVGYLPLALSSKAATATTFLFLTMDGTPEGEKLRKRLRIARKEREILRLDELTTFTASDLASDPFLVQAFDECGCGHLMTMENRSHTPIAEGVAARVREHLDASGVDLLFRKR